MKIFIKNNSKITLMVILAMLVQIIMPITGNIALAENVSNIIDSIKVAMEDGGVPENGELRPGDRIRIDVEWSIKQGADVKAGDTFSIELPEELRGYTGTIYLKNESGEVFGTCLGTGSIVTCTFSDLVEKRDNISGFFYIESQINSMEQTVI